MILAALDAAAVPEDMNRPSFRLHMLRGDRKGQWAVTVRANWRIVFRITDGNVIDVDFLDYHGRADAMPMKNPPHPGPGLKDEFAELGLSIATAADALGISRSQLHRVVAGASDISPELALRLEVVIGGTAEAWLRQQASYDAAAVRRKGDHITLGLKRIAPPSERAKDGGGIPV